MFQNKKVLLTNITVATDQIKKRRKAKKTKRKAIEKELKEVYLDQILDWAGISLIIINKEVLLDILVPF